MMVFVGTLNSNPYSHLCIFDERPSPVHYFARARSFIIKEAPKPGEQGSNPGRGAARQHFRGDRDRACCKATQTHRDGGVQGTTDPAARQHSTESIRDSSG